MTQTAIPCAVMRGGTSKGLMFLVDDLPGDRETRDAALLAAMGSPDERQIDGMGGSHPHESPAELEGDPQLTWQIEAIRLAAGALMNLGDVIDTTVPKMSLLSPPAHGGAISTRTFIPHRVHEAIGVLGAVSVATACVLPGSVAHAVAAIPEKTEGSTELEVEHPTGFFTVTIEVKVSDGTVTVTRSALLRTARLLMRGNVFVPSSVWSPA